MTTVSAVYLRPGRCVGVCDARCYNAMQPSELKEPRRNACKCICGGANHGMGQARAVKNTIERGVGLRTSDLVAFAERRGFDPDALLVVDRLRASAFVAARLAKERFNPVPIAPDDLFYCEGLAGPLQASALGPDAGTSSNNVSPSGDPA